MHEASKTAEFGDHKMSQEALSIGDPELAGMRKRLGIKKNVGFRIVILSLRFLDGSLIVRYLYQRRLVGRMVDLQKMEIK